MPHVIAQPLLHKHITRALATGITQHVLNSHCHRIVVVEFYSVVIILVEFVSKRTHDGLEKRVDSADIEGGVVKQYLLQRRLRSLFQFLLARMEQGHQFVFYLALTLA